MSQNPWWATGGAKGAVVRVIQRISVWRRASNETMRIEFFVHFPGIFRWYSFCSGSNWEPKRSLEIYLDSKSNPWSPGQHACVFATVEQTSHSFHIIVDHRVVNINVTMFNCYAINNTPTN